MMKMGGVWMGMIGRGGRLIKCGGFFKNERNFAIDGFSDMGKGVIVFCYGGGVLGVGW
jgi:hypothetical protein